MELQGEGKGRSEMGLAKDILQRLKRRPPGFNCLQGGKQYLSPDFPDYHLAILESINQECSLRGKFCLDIGGSNIPAEVMQLFGVQKFVCLDPVSKWFSTTPANLHSRYLGKKIYRIGDLQTALDREFSFILDEDVESLNQEMSGAFDLAMSISAFEHVTSLTKTLDVIYDLLSPQGVLYSQYEPIFSCAAGHHVWINEDYNFNNMPEIDHIHLLYTREEAELFLNKINRFDPYIKKVILEQSYDSKKINRFKLDEHVRAFQNAKFNNFQISYFYLEPVPEERLEVLYRKHGYMRFDVRGIKYVARKALV